MAGRSGRAHPGTPGRRPRRSRVWRLAPFAVVLAAVATAGFGVLAGNTVAPSRLDVTAQAQGPNQVKPSECNGITLTAYVNGSSGSGNSDLQLGTSGIDTMNGAGGNDCILGGSGADTIDGGTGTDVCLGEGGTDIFLNCETTVQ